MLVGSLGTPWSPLGLLPPWGRPAPSLPVLGTGEGEAGAFWTPAKAVWIWQCKLACRSQDSFKSLVIGVAWDVAISLCRLACSHPSLDLWLGAPCPSCLGPLEAHLCMVFPRQFQVSRHRRCLGCGHQPLPPGMLPPLALTFGLESPVLTSSWP